MRVTRAYIAGFGTAGSLLAGAAMVFVMASAVVAFKGWPQVGSAASPAAVIFTRPHLVAASSAERRLAAVARANPAASASHVSAGHAGRAVTRHGQSLARSERVSLGSRHRGSGTVTRVSVPPTTPAAPSPPQSTGCGSSCATPPATNTLATAVQGSTSALGSTVAGTGKTLGSTVSGVVGTVASKLAGVSPPLASTVSAAGNALGNTVNQTTGAVGGLLTGTGKTLGALLGNH
jgi:hypothetical protein